MGFNKVDGDTISAAQLNRMLADAGLFGSSSGGTDAYAITVDPVPNDYDLGDTYCFKADVANTGAATLNINSLGAKTIRKFGGTQDLVTGDILASQLVVVKYDGTYFQMMTMPNLASNSPTIQVLTSNVPVGSSTTQFDITNPAGTTFRYTYDATGTDPLITALTHPIGTIVDIQGQNFASGNKGLFAVTGSGANYIEVSNASGVVESNKTLGTGYLNKGGIYTKPAGLKYVKIRMVGAGSAGDGTTSSDSAQDGGAGGGYLEKIIAAASLASTVNYCVGYKTVGVQAAVTAVAGRSIFAHSVNLIATGATGSATPGTASGGDINMTSQRGVPGIVQPSAGNLSGQGASTLLGIGGMGTTSGDGIAATGYGAGGGGGDASGTADVAGGDGASGVILIEEYYIQ